MTLAEKPAKKPATTRKAAAARKPAGAKADGKPVLLSGGNPQIAKADGDEAVQAYIAAMPDWKSDVGKRLDALIVRTIPDVRKAVKWNSPLYGVEGQGWFVGLHCFTKYIKIAFFQGASLQLPPPVTSRHQDTRYFHIHADDPFEDELLARWIAQAAQLPGWVP
ncbi:DUF1801 domain-containing protein [Bosea thiooxidans]|uniref:DUF1801 domain-containing protein n=1 Tax=Bosea thiooxidans TaxID=53254 RepID=UPI00159019A6|nr:DUF1801 domain-containing protein [Bosea thiooxidans]